MMQNAESLFAEALAAACCARFYLMLPERIEIESIRIDASGTLLIDMVQHCSPQLIEIKFDLKEAIDVSDYLSIP